MVNAQSIEPPAARSVLVRRASDAGDLRNVGAVLTAIWGGTREGGPLRPELLTALLHSGAYIGLAERDGAAVGACIGWIGIDADPGVNAPYLHSHITGVAAGHRDAGIGFALKQDQRAWALDRGLGRIDWTFDPLLRRNAFFNVHCLGATVGTYHPDFYGPMEDDLNRGEATDRVVADWDLDDPRVAEAAVRRPVASAAAEHVARGAVVVLAVDADGGPSPSGAAVRGRVALLATPPDAVALRGSDRSLADAWRASQREHLGALLDDGWHLVDVTSDGSYVARHLDDLDPRDSPIQRSSSPRSPGSRSSS